MAVKLVSYIFYIGLAPKAIQGASLPVRYLNAATTANHAWVAFCLFSRQ